MSVQCDALSFLSDALLALCERSPDRPHYSEATFQKKLSVARRREAAMPLPASPGVTDGLFRKEWQFILKHAGLTERQRDVCLQRLAGWTFVEIGRQGGHSKQGAQNIFFQALKKIRSAWRVYPYAGLSSIYRQEVSRGARPAGAGRLKG